MFAITECHLVIRVISDVITAHGLNHTPANRENHTTVVSDIFTEKQSTEKFL